MKSVNIENIDLLPCPWCNMRPEVFTEIDEFRIECINESCQVTARTHWKPSFLEVAKDWNTRA